MSHLPDVTTIRWQDASGGEPVVVCACGRVRAGLAVSAADTCSRAGKPAWGRLHRGAGAPGAPREGVASSHCTVTSDDGPGTDASQWHLRGGSSSSRPDHVLDLACLTAERRRQTATPRSCPRNGRPQLSSPEPCALIPREPRKPLPTASTLFRPLRGAGRSPPVYRQPSRSRWA